ncbi:MAG TPA: glycosyltransferase 87 family protein [Elusimicrobiota bacterium]|nr:glycosyltransferase 87 family protein [Elusimicrobiota bacterium]
MNRFHRLTESRRRTFLLAAGLAAAAAAAAFLVDTARTQWDLKIYMECSRTLASGADPYATQPVFNGDHFQCLYPPLIMDLYRPFNSVTAEFGEGAGERFWAVLKVASMFLMLWLWKARILRPGNDLRRLLFAAIAYGSPFWSDFRAGNAGSFEHLILWGALAAFIAERDYLFAALIAAAAQPKILPAAFLPLVLAKRRPNWGAFVFGGALALGAFGLNELVHPGLLKEFFLQLRDPAQPWHYERGPNNCAFVGLVQHALETAWRDRARAMAAAMRVNLVWSAAVAALTAWALRGLWSGPGTETGKRRASLMLYAAAYALVAPRLKDYSFLLLIPPTLVALESDAPPALRAAILVCALLDSTKAAAEKMGLGVWSLFAGYFKLYAVMLVWYALAFRSKKTLESPSE